METSAITRDSFLWKQAKERVGFKMHLRSFGIINFGLWLIYLVSNLGALTNPNLRGFHFPWPLFATLGWGIGLVSHYFAVYQRPGQRDLVEREYEKLKNGR